MAEIPLTKGRVAIVDDSRYNELSQYKWRAVECQPGRFYAQRYERGVDHAHRRAIYMHRQVFGAERSIKIDHVNNDSLDNRLANLRLATKSQNRANSQKHRHRAGRPTSSRYKGVSWSRVQGKWVATIRPQTGWQYLGRYDREEDAARAYNAAAIEAFGEFAQINEV